MSISTLEVDVELALIDLDNTIYDFESVGNYSRNELAKYLAQETKTSAAAILQCYAEIADETSTTIFRSGLEMRRCRLEMLSRRLHIAFSIEAAAWLLDERIVQSIRPYPGAVEAIAVVQACCPLVIFTEGYADIQHAAATKLGLGGYEMFASLQHHTRKSDGSAYEEIIRQKNLRPSGIVMIGDHWINDVMSPAGLGIATLWISHGRSPPGPPPERFLGSAPALINCLPLLGIASSYADD
jgi:FMN phosphatase YigB (HAD superfamily)